MIDVKICICKECKTPHPSNIPMLKNNDDLEITEGIHFIIKLRTLAEKEGIPQEQAIAFFNGMIKSYFPQHFADFDNT